MMKAFRCCLGGRLRQASAITTALSPLSTTLMTAILTSAIQISGSVRVASMAVLLLAEDRHLDGDGDVGMQRDLDRVLADLLERSLRHAHVGALHLVPLLLQRLDDVVVGHRAEQAPVGARLLRDLQR